MTNVSIRRVEEITGVPKETSETSREYLKRVGDLAEIPHEEISQIITIFEQAQFSPDGSLGQEKIAQVDDFYANIENLIQSNIPETGVANKTDGSDFEKTSTDVHTQVGTAKNGRGSDKNVTTETSSVAKNQLRHQDTPSNATYNRYSHLRSALSDEFKPIVQQLNAVVDEVINWFFRTSYDVVFAVSIFFIGSFFYLRNLDKRALRNWDEGIYANAAQHMAQNGNWLVPHIEGGLGPTAIHPFLEKTPLSIWFQAISMEIFGIGVFAARLPSALLTILTAVVVYFVGREMKSRIVGLTGAAIFLSTPYVYVGNNAGRAAATDIPLVFFGTCFVVLTWLVSRRDNQRLIPVVCLAAALAVLSKGFGAAPFVFVVLPLVATSPRDFTSKKMLKSVVGFLCIIIPWPAYMWLQFGDEFIYEIFISQVLQRATGSSFSAQSGTIFDFMRFPYLNYFPTFFDPWGYFLLPATVGLPLVTIVQKRYSELKDQIFLLWWTGVVIGFYSLTGNHGWYILPAYVPAALFVGWLFNYIIEGDLIALGTTLIGLLLASVLSFRSTLPTSAQGTDILPVHGFSEGVLFYMAMAAVVILLAGYRRFGEVAKNRLSRDDFHVVSHVVPVLCVVCVLLVLMGPTPGWGGSDQSVGESIDQNVPNGELVSLSDQLIGEGVKFSLAFYATNPIDHASVSEMNKDSDIRYAVIHKPEEQGLEREYEVLDRVNSGETYLIIRLTS
ncbi:glycosyltransferase family 39 protein [Haloferax marisrubri]|nr:glycosyltransferase family 39 protein [Haloferax marisrubri]